MDVDSALDDIRQEMFQALVYEYLDAEMGGALLRAAYGKGYIDALREEDEGRRGELAERNGYRAPERGERAR